MTSLTESIKLNEAGNMQWEVLKELSIPVSITKFTAPDKQYLWINHDTQAMSFESLVDIKSSFEDFDMEDEFKEVSKLKVGESWCVDGLNIYLRLY